MNKKLYMTFCICPGHCTTDGRVYALSLHPIKGAGFWKMSLTKVYNYYAKISFRGMCTVQKSKPLVCGLFGPHPHAHRTKIVMCGARTRTANFCTRTRTRTRTNFQKKFQKKNFFQFFFFFSCIEIEKCAKKWTCGRAGARLHLGARPHLKKQFTHAPARTFLKNFPHLFAQKSPHPHVCACGDILVFWRFPIWDIFFHFLSWVRFFQVKKRSKSLSYEQLLYQNAPKYFFAQSTSLWNWFFHSNYLLLLETFFKIPLL